jgi:peptidyl-prolyl cis-trans isomerase B (cyclophilin B)
VKATISTKKGNIVIELYPDLAPNTVANFVTKAKAGYYDGLKWHRVEDWVVQGGDPKGNGTGGGTMPAEYNDGKFSIGAVGIARGQDRRINNDSQFFITKKDSQFLNGDYTYFGQVTQGQNVAGMLTTSDKIQGITIEE